MRVQYRNAFWHDDDFKLDIISIGSNDPNGDYGFRLFDRQPLCCLTRRDSEIGDLPRISLEEISKLPIILCET